MCVCVCVCVEDIHGMERCACDSGYCGVGGEGSGMISSLRHGIMWYMIQTQRKEVSGKYG